MATEDFESEAPPPPGPPLDSRPAYVDTASPPDAQPGTASGDITGSRVTVDRFGDLAGLRLTSTALDAGPEALAAEILQLYHSALEVARNRAQAVVEVTDGRPLPCRRRAT